jgi:hypothetical protein
VAEFNPAFRDNFNTYRRTSFDEYKALEPVRTAGEVIGMAFDQAMDDTAVMLWARRSATNELSQRGRKLTPEEANARFPGMMNPFREDTSEVLAEHLWTREQERQEIARKMSQGPGGMLETVGTFGAGLMAHLMDPIEIGASMLTGMGFGVAAQATAMGARLGASAAAGSRSARIGLHTMEAGSGNLLENMIHESFIASQMMREGMDPATLGEAAINVGISTIAGTTLGVGIKELASAIAGVKPMVRTENLYQRNVHSVSPELDTLITKATLADIAEGRVPDMAPLMKAAAYETSVGPMDFPNRGLDYQYRPLSRADVATKDFYFVTRGVEVDSLQARAGDDIGFGKSLTDSPYVSNAVANRSMNDGAGTIHRVRFDDLNFVDLQQVAPQNIRPAIEKALKAVGEKEVVARLDNTKLREVMDLIRDAADVADNAKVLQDLETDIRAAGYDALLDNGKKRLHIDDHVEHNHVILLDDSKLKSTGTFDGDPTMVKSPTMDDMKNVVESRDNPARNSAVDEEALVAADNKLKEIGKDDTLEFKPEEVRRKTEEAIEELEGLELIGELDDSARAELSALKERIEAMEARDKGLKALIGCVGA